MAGGSNPSRGTMPSLDDLANLNEGLILISGARGSGKTTACAAILRRWKERGFPYQHFAIRRPDGDPLELEGGEALQNYGGRPTADNVQYRSRGHRYVLVDEPLQLGGDFYEDILPRTGVRVIATSDILPWMAQTATWVCYTSAPATVTIYPGPTLATSVSGWPQPPTIWERLLLSDTS